MAGIYEQWITSLRLSWLGTTAKRIMGGFAAALGDRTGDPSVGWARAALLERLPLRASRAAVNLTAVDRGIELGLAESDASAADRVARAVLQSRLYGTPLGMLVAMHYAGFPGAMLVTQNGQSHKIDGTPSLDDLENLTTLPSWYAIDDLGPNPAIPTSTDGKAAIVAGTIPWWTFDGGMDTEGNQYCGRFGVLFPVGTTPNLTDAERLAQLRRIARRWRPAKAKCMGFWVVNTNYWGEPGLTWGSGPNWEAAVNNYYSAE